MAGHEAIRLGSKAFAVLRCLVTHAGQLVTKDTLLQTVWPETAVNEAVLTVAMGELRRRLEIRRAGRSLSRPSMDGAIGLLPRSRWRSRLDTGQESDAVRHRSPPSPRPGSSSGVTPNGPGPAVVRESAPGERQMGFIAG